MIRSVRMRNFKAWPDTGEVALAPITGFFGANSAGKSSLVQMLLLLKQTAQSPDRALILNLGDDRAPLELGTYADAVYNHDTKRSIEVSLRWDLPKPLRSAVVREGSSAYLTAEPLG